MLWACELKPRSWWVDGFNFVRICVRLLHILGNWLTDARCQHYFINNCNLIDNSFNVTNIGIQLMSIDTTWLSKWFVDNYIRKCSQLCPDNVCRLFDDVSTSMKLQHAVSSVIVWRQNNTILDLWLASQSMEFIIPLSLTIFDLNAQSCVRWMNELANMYSHLSVYFTVVAFLHVAYKSSTRGLTYVLMDVLATLFGQFLSKRRYSTNIASLLSLGQAAKMMKVVANKSHSTVQLIMIELSKAYLYRALSCEDSDSDSIYCLTNVYLAVLHYTTGQYQTAIDHCTLVMRSQDHSQCSSHVVQGELLPKINDDIDNVLGLAVLYQHVRVTALNDLNQRCQIQYVSVLTTELLAYYLHIECLSVAVCYPITHISSAGEFKRYKVLISDTEELFIGDVLLFVSLSRLLKQNYYDKPVCQQFHQLPMNRTELNASDLVELLQKSAVEHLTTYRQMQALDFGSVATIVTTDFEALYAYKCGDYQRCLQLSTQNVHTLWYADDMPFVPTFPEFIQLMDDDIVSLTALTLIVNPEGRDHNTLCVTITQLTLSLYLMTQCQLNLRHSVMSLAQIVSYIDVVHRQYPVEMTLDRLVLKMIAHKALMYITPMNNGEQSDNYSGIHPPFM